MRSRPVRVADQGFTLIELLIATAILVVLMTGLTAAMIVSLESVVGRSQSVTDTSGAQLLSSYLVTDAQSADVVKPASTCDSGAGVLLELRWTDADGTTGTTDVVYKTEATSASDSRLVRDTYTVSSGGSCAAAGSTVIVPDVDPAQTAAKCDGGSTCNSGSTVVGLHVTACSSDPRLQDAGCSDTSATGYRPYRFDVSGARRLS